MIDDATRTRVRALLDAVRDRPSEMPMAQLLDLTEAPVAIEVDRRGSEPVVIVTPRPDPRFDVLTSREYEVATLMAAGFSNRQIADTLFIAIATVKDHVHSILSKTALASRSEVAAAWHGRI